MNLGVKGRRLSVVLVVAAFSLFTSNAAAHHIVLPTGTPPVFDPLDNTRVTGQALEEVRNLVKTGTIKPTWSPGTQEEVETTVEKAGRRSRLLPMLRVLGGVGIAASVVDATFGWKVCLETVVSGVCPGGFIYKQITGDSYANGGSGLEYGWSWAQWSTGGFYNGGTSPLAWWFSAGSNCAPGPGRSCAAPRIYCSPANVSGCNISSTHNNAGNAAVGTQVGQTNSVNQCGSGVPINNCVIKMRTEQQMDDLTKGKNITVEQYNALTKKFDTGTYIPPETPTTGDKAEAAAALGTPGNQSDAQKGAEEAVQEQLAPGSTMPDITMPNCIGLSQTSCDNALDIAGHTGTRTYVELGRQGAVMTQPAGAVVTQSVGATTSTAPDTELEFERNPDPMPIEIFNPAGNEAWPEYLQRLRDAGWLGTVLSPETLSPETGDPRYGPGVAVRIKVGAGPRITVRFPVAAPAPRIDVNEDLTPVRNPQEYPEKENPSEPDGPGTNLPPGTAEPPPPVGGDTSECGPTVPTLNVDPMEEIDFGEKFPFGIFGWIATALAPLTAAPVAPEFDVAIDLPGVGEGEINVDLSPADPLMSILRLLASIGIAIAAIYLFATSIMGFRAGNAGGGLDDDA